MQHTTLVQFILPVLAFMILPISTANANKLYFYARAGQYQEINDNDVTEETSLKAGGIYLNMTADMGKMWSERALGDHEFGWSWYIDSYFGGGSGSNGGVFDFSAQPFGIRGRYNLGGDNLVCFGYSPIEINLFLPTGTGIGSLFSLSLERKNLQIHISRYGNGLFLGAFYPDKAMNPSYTATVQYILRSGLTVGLQAGILTGKDMEGFNAMLFGGWVF
ncbi:MAG: hypothetical protein CVU59_08900 [Deltaproteobacteria bacterium HGW-Deltaproteobacteria-17]|nr:MAG: hypothetical protein CVU59_08900 [Deltaproteobacteria bacterium HGW-Deltaproteobacteria-17]